MLVVGDRDPVLVTSGPVYKYRHTHTWHYPCCCQCCCWAACCEHLILAVCGCPVTSMCQLQHPSSTDPIINLPGSCVIQIGLSTHIYRMQKWVIYTLLQVLRGKKLTLHVLGSFVHFVTIWITQVQFFYIWVTEGTHVSKFRGCWI